MRTRAYLIPRRGCCNIGCTFGPYAVAEVLIRKTFDMDAIQTDICTPAPRWTVEFSLALHNKTGKYFIGKDILSDQADLIGQVLYWRRGAKTTPGGYAAKALGRALHYELTLRRNPLLRTAGRLRPRNPVLHLDPFTVLFHHLAPKDLVLCHDMGPITHPDLFTQDVCDLYNRAYDQIAAAQTRMAFVSQTTRDEFTRLYGPVPDMTVAYPPIRAAVSGLTGQAVAQVSGKFLLTVGSLGLRKNQSLTIAAFAKSELANSGWSYVLCGAREPGFEEVLAQAARTPGVIVLPYVSDAELVWLYTMAGGFVLVSNLEGFGMPVAEAISRGLVPLVSRSSVLEEVAGPAALTANPKNLDEISIAMQAIAHMPDQEREERVLELKKSLGRFSQNAFRSTWAHMLRRNAEQPDTD